MIKVILFIPFIFFHYFSDIIILPYIVLTSIFLFSLNIFKKNYSVPKNISVIIFFLILYVIISYLILDNRYDFFDFTSLGHARFLYLAIGFFLFTIIFRLIGDMNHKDLKTFFILFFYISIISILLEVFLINILHFDQSIIPTFRDSTSYKSPVNVFGFSYFRPYGLTGSAPVNGCLVVILMWVVYLQNNKSRYLIVSLPVILLTASGSAIITLVGSFAAYMFLGTKNKIFIFLILLLGLVAIISAQSNASTSFAVEGFQKINLDYLIYFFNFLRIEENILNMNILHNIFGGLGSYQDIYADPSNNTEWYFIYSVSRFGLIITLVIWVFIFVRLRFGNYQIVAVSIFLSCLHVGTILYVPTIIIFCILEKNREALIQSNS